MRQFKAYIAVFVARIVTALLHLFGRGGTSLPGMIALKLCPDVLRNLASGVDVIFVTGTNGKTTTTHMIAQILQDANVPFFTNDAGANMITGITAAFINKKKTLPNGERQIALMECDEASLRKVTAHVQPRIIVVTNLFRDQLDRYGEISTTLNLIKEGIVLAGDSTTLCLNADCSYTASLGRGCTGKVLYFGFGKAAAKFGNCEYCEDAVSAQSLQNSQDNEVSQAAEALSCIFCGAPYKYEYHNFGHLGSFYCEECGWKRPCANVEVEKILELAPAYSRVSVKRAQSDTTQELKISLAAKFNIYNAAAALCVAQELRINDDIAFHALGNMSSSFGRMESFELDANTSLLMLLTKNPTGADQVIEYVQSCVQQSKNKAALVLCLNDKSADGTDISWIWDVNYERLADLDCNKIIVWGTRAHDMRLRLLYAGVSRELIELVEGEDALLDAVVDFGGSSNSNEKQQVYLLANYTSMMELRDFFAHACGKASFWNSGGDKNE
jgi:lipid II isoglutaminyl synthase (glutamine-hydrolysing)